jgi:hypothetical protein
MVVVTIGNRPKSRLSSEMQAERFGLRRGNRSTRQRGRYPEMKVLLFKEISRSADVSEMNFRVRRVLLAFLLGSLGMFPLRAQNPDISATRSKVLALEHVWNQAEASKDMKALDSIFDNFLVYVDTEGSLLTKAEFLSRVKSAHLQQVTTQSMTVQVFDNTAVVTGTYQAVEFKSGKPVVSHGRFIDTWAYRNSSWVCVAAQSTPILR